jgi:Tfp pilus assembly protein PilN
MQATRCFVLATILAFASHGTAAQTPAPKAATATTQSVTTALQALVPPGVTVGPMRQEGDKYIFGGASGNNAALSDFMRKAMSSPGLRDVELREIAQDGAQYRYEMSIRVDCTAPGASRSGAACAAPAKGQSVHKCRIDGTVTFQAAPCPAGSET